MAESFSRQKSRHAPQKEGGLKILCDLGSCVTPAGTSNELDVQNGWEENTHTHRSEKDKRVQRFVFFANNLSRLRE